MGDNPTKAVELTAAETALLIEKKATCPFIGSAVADGVLPVRNDANDPLASIEDVRRLGNTGGGDLGDLLVLFASGNHAYMLGDAGKLDKRVPPGLFSLELPGSQGSHPGHSGILQGDPDVPNSGRLSEADFARLTSHAKDGWIKRSEVGRFIAGNVLRDPKSRVLTKDTAALLASDLGDLIQITGSVLLGKLSPSGESARGSHRDIEERLTKLLGEDNIVGSAGEFGLLFAFLANKPGARKIDGEPAVAVADLKAMFVDKHLPSRQAAEKDPYASLRLIDFASTYKSTPPLIDLRAPCLWIFLNSLQERDFFSNLLDYPTAGKLGKNFASIG